MGYRNSLENAKRPLGGNETVAALMLQFDPRTSSHGDDYKRFREQLLSQQNTELPSDAALVGSAPAAQVWGLSPKNE